MELVIARHLLRQRAPAQILEHDEVPDQVEEPPLVEHRFEHHLQLDQLRSRILVPADGTPGLEPLAPRPERSDPRLQPVGHHEGRVVGEERWDLGLVGLELLKRRPDRGVLIRRVLQLDHRQRQAVDEDDTTSARRVCWFSETVNWLTTSQSLLSGASKSSTRA